MRLQAYHSMRTCVLSEGKNATEGTQRYTEGYYRILSVVLSSMNKGAFQSAKVTLTSLTLRYTSKRLESNRTCESPHVDRNLKCDIKPQERSRFVRTFVFWFKHEKEIRFHVKCIAF